MTIPEFKVRNEEKRSIIVKELIEYLRNFNENCPVWVALHEENEMCCLSINELEAGWHKEIDDIAPVVLHSNELKSS